MEHSESGAPLLAQAQIHAGTTETLLAAVGRTAHPAFHPFPRPQKSSPELDALEVQWWNKNGALIEKVWGLPKEICEALRRPYVKRTSELMNSTGIAGPIVELGCGTGWFGRMLADHGHQVIGIDNSSTQIQIAQHLASLEGKSSACTYHCTDGLSLLQNFGSLQGMIIHCFLHHLYWDELSTLFNELSAILVSQTPILIVEPVYPRAFAPPSEAARSRPIGQAFAQAQMHIGQIRQALEGQNALDFSIQHALQKIIEESEKSGFFFSPKEVPFYDWELRNFLVKYGAICEEFVCGVTDFEVAQILGLVRDQGLRTQLAGTLLPEFQKIDKSLLSDPDLFDALSERYLFKCFWMKLH